MTRRILVLDGHPAPHSLSRLFAETYAKNARRAGHDVRLLHLSELAFDPDFGQGNYKDFKRLEPSLDGFMADLEWAEHFVVTTPLWWGGLPALLKGLIDRAFVPGRAFDPRTPNRMGVPAPLLEGRTGRVILTSDTPMWVERWLYRRGILNQITHQVMGFVGIKPTRYTWFSGASKAQSKQVDGWTAKVAKIGAAAL